MNCKKLNSCFCSSNVVLKNDADAQCGKLRGKRYTTVKVTAQISSSRLPARKDRLMASRYCNLPSPEIRAMIM